MRVPITTLVALAVLAAAAEAKIEVEQLTGRYRLESALMVGAGGLRVRGVLLVAPADNPDNHHMHTLRLQVVDGVVERQGAKGEWRKAGKGMRGAPEGPWGVALEEGAENVTLYLDGNEEAGVRNYRRILGAGLVGALGGLWGCGLQEHRPDERTLHVAGGCGGVRRVWRYSRGVGGALDALAGEEVWAAPPPVQLRARSWLRLTREGDALKAPLPAHLTLHALAVETAPQEDDHEKVDWEALIALLADAGRAGAGGGVAEARVAAELVMAVRRASADALRDLVSKMSKSGLGGLPVLLYALGAAGTAPARRAAAPALGLQAPGDAALHLVHHYFQGLGVAHAPDDEVVSWALEVGEGVGDARIRAAAVLGGAGAGGRAKGRAAHTQRALRALSRCDDPPCRALWLRALGALDAATAAPALAEHAARPDAAPALAALMALGAAPAHALPASFTSRLLRLALDLPPLSGPRPLEVRGHALVLGVHLAALHAPGTLAGAARALAQDQGPLGGELRRMLWDAAAQHPALHQHLRSLPIDLLALPLYAHNGTSGVVGRTAWAGGGWRADLGSVSANAGGLLRHQVVTLGAAQHDAGDLQELLRVEVWARGLHALAGGEAPPGAAADEGAAAELSLAVRGGPLPALPLFDGQAALLAALWAGAGSEPTPVVRAHTVLQEGSGEAQVLMGSVGGRWVAALALALDGSGAASLWARTAQARLALRAAALATATARASTPWGALAATASAASAPALHIAADLDFYDRPTLCVLAATAAHKHSVNATTMTSLGTHSRYDVTRLPGNTLALAQHIHDACRHTHTNDDT